MKKLLIFLLLLSGVAYGQSNNTTNTKFTNGLAVPNGATQKPTSGLTAGALSYVTGVGLYVYNGSSWELLGLSSGGVTSFNSRTGIVVPEIGDYSSFYVPLTRSLTINGATQTLAADRTWTVTANTTNSLTNGYGLTGGVFDGSVARTWVVDTASVSGLVSKLRLATNLTGYVKKATTITINGVTQDLSDNRIWTAGTVTSVGATAGTGISVTGSPITSSGNITITNTAPDQTVTLTGGTGISTSGTYPNFTITNTSPSPSGLQDSLTKKANRTFDNVASGAIAKAKVDTSANGLLPKSNLFPLGDTRYLKLGGIPTGISATSPIFYSSGTGVISSQAASSTLEGYVTTGTQTFSGLKTFANNIEAGTIGTAGKLSLKRSSDGVIASTVEQIDANKLTLTSAGGTKLFDINADRVDFNSGASTATYWFGQNRPSATEVLINGSNNNKLILQNNEVAQLTLNSNGGTITAASLGSSGDVIVGANNTGLAGKITVGSGLSLTAGVLTATGGSSGSVTTAGGTAGRIAKFTSASNIENSTITESGSDISISGNVTSASFIKSAGTSSQFLKADGSVDGSTYLTSSTGVTSITGTSNQVVASASTGAVTLSLPQSIATSSTPQFTSIGLGASPLYTLDATKSVSGNYIGHLHNTNTTAGTSFGLFIKAGTNGSDYALNINTADNLTNLFNLTGAGDAMIKNDISAGGTNGFSGKSLLIGTDGTIANYRWQTSLSGNDEIFASRSFGTVRTTNYTTGATVYSGALSATNLSGTNTGDQTTITGNAGTATALQTARNIQGVSFNGTADINPINGTGFVKASGTTLSYDNSTYLTTSLASSTYAPINSPTFTGTPSLPTGTIAVTQTQGDNSTKIATTAYVDGSLTSKTNRILKDWYTDANNVTTSETDLYDYTVPSNTLINNGDKLYFEIGGSYGSTANSKDLRLYFGNSGFLFQSTTSTGGYWTIKGFIVKVDATNYRIVSTNSDDGPDKISIYSSTGTVTNYTGTNVFRITGTATDSADITAKAGYLEFKPAAP